MPKVVVSGSDVTTGQLRDFFRMIEDGTIRSDNLRCFTENPNRFTPKEISINRAIKLLGARNVITAEQASSAWEAKAPAKAVLQIREPSIQSAADTNKNKTTRFMLVYCLGLSLKEQRDRWGIEGFVSMGFYREDAHWLDERKDEPWAQERRTPGYRLLDFNSRFHNWKDGTTWQQQEDAIKKLGSGFCRAHEADVVEAYLSCIRVYGPYPRLLASVSHWGQALTSDGERVIVGRTISGSVSVHGGNPDQPSTCGVVISRR